MNKAKITVTLPLSCERQDLLVKATTAGQKFRATGGDALNCDNFFISEQRKINQARIKILTARKEKNFVYTTAASKATTIMNNLMSEKRINLYMGMMTANNNLVCPQLALLYHLKHGKNPKSRSSKAVLVKAYTIQKILPLSMFWTGRLKTIMN